MDDRLQDLRRRVAAGDVAARPELLVARVRAGELAQERLELAAYGGDEAAIHAVGAERTARLLLPVVTEHARAIRLGGMPASTLEPWVRGLVRWGREVVVRAAVAAARAALPAWDDRHTSGHCSAPHRTIEAAEAWLVCPCEEHRLACEAAVPPPPDHHEPETWWRWPCVAIYAGDDGWWTSHLSNWTEQSAELAGEAAVRDAIRTALVPWALGEAAP